MLCWRVNFSRLGRESRAISAAECRFREQIDALDDEVRLRDCVEPTAKDERDPNEFS